MTDHEASAPSLLIMAGAFIKRPGMFLGAPIRFDRVTAFISGYALAIDQVRGALSPDDGQVFRPGGVEGQFQQQLRDEGVTIGVTAWLRLSASCWLRLRRVPCPLRLPGRGNLRPAIPRVR